MKEGASYGEYRTGKILLDISKNNDIVDSHITQTHELVHGLLCGCNSWGFADSLFEILCQDEEIEAKLKSRFKKIRSIFFDNSIQVQESVAVFAELEFTKNIDHKKYQELKFLYRNNNKKYYIQYRFRELECFLEYPNAFKSIFNIANAAMEINLYQIEILKNSAYQTIKKNELKYNPNKRFWKAIKYIKKNNIPICKYTNTKEVQALFNVLNIFYYNNMTTEELYLWAKTTIFDIFLPNRNMYEYIQLYNSSSEEIIGKMIQSTCAYTSVATYKKKYCSHDELLTYISNRRGLIWLDQKNFIFYVDTYNGYIYCQKSENLDLINNIICQPICFDRNHYKYYLNKSKTLINKFRIVDVAGIDEYGKAFINNKSSKKMFGALINNTTILLFIIGNDDNELLAQALPLQVFSELRINGIFKNYKFVDPACVYDSVDIISYIDDYALFCCQDKIDFDDKNDKENIVWIFEDSNI